MFKSKYQKENVKENIRNRLINRINEGLIEEVKDLLNGKTTSERLHYFGLEYRYINDYLKKLYTEEELIEKLTGAIQKFSKKQMTFFRRMEKRGVKIEWISKANINLIKKIM